MSRTFITTAIPYVNSKPHLGFAMELVQTDVMARHRRHRGHEVRFLSGTDDNSLKNAIAAESEGVPTRELVDRNAAAFHNLRDPLRVSFDDFLRTSADPRHAVGVNRMWKAVEAAGDLALRDFSGLYCVGCEQFYDEPELVDGLCPEHRTAPQRVNERNWFFKLSRYEQRLRDVIEHGELRIEPEARRNEVLSFLDGGLRDFSVSRSRECARDWGIPVPGGDGQVVHVWFDALINYITSLDYGTGGADFDRWWTDADADDVVHVIGKGILRFHRCTGRRCSCRRAFRYRAPSSSTTTSPPTAGNWANRWETPSTRRSSPRSTGRTPCGGGSCGKCREPATPTSPRNASSRATGKTSPTGSEISSTARCRWCGSTAAGRFPVDALPTDEALVTACETVPGEVDAAMERFDFRTATAAIFGIVDDANRYVETTTPWTLAHAEKNGDAAATKQLNTALATLVHACRTLADELTPFLPDAAREAARQLGDGQHQVGNPSPLFPRIEIPTEE